MFTLKQGMECSAVKNVAMKRKFQMIVKTLHYIITEGTFSPPNYCIHSVNRTEKINIK